MKFKTILFIILLFILVPFIYFITMDKEIYYLNISNDKTEYSYTTYIRNYLEGQNKLEKYINDFVEQDDRVTDIIYAIKENAYVTIEQKKHTIKNALIKADLVTIFVGLNDINYKVGYSSMSELYEYADSFLVDLNEMLKIIREYCKENIIFIGYYNIYGSYYDDYFNYINKKAQEICKDYNIKFVSLSKIYDSNKHISDILINREENQKLASEIIKIIKY